MVEQAVQRWRGFLAGGSPEELYSMLAEDIVFHTPIIYPPQRGRDVTMFFLQAARQALVDGGDGAFRFTRQAVSGDLAMLEFETTLGTVHVNGVDVIRCDSAGRIVEFRVMIRPLQAVNAMLLAIAAAHQPGADLAAARCRRPGRRVGHRHPRRTDGPAGPR